MVPTAPPNLSGYPGNIPFILSSTVSVYSVSERGGVEARAGFPCLLQSFTALGIIWRVQRRLQSQSAPYHHSAFASVGTIGTFPHSLSAPFRSS